MKLCSLLLCLAVLTAVKAVEVEVGTETEVASKVQTDTKTNVSPKCTSSNPGWVWSTTFLQTGRGGAVFTLENVPTITVPRYYYLPTSSAYGQVRYDPIKQVTYIPQKQLHDLYIGISTRTADQGDPSAVFPFLEIVLETNYGTSNPRSVIRSSHNGKEIAFREHDTDRVKAGSSYWVTLYDNVLSVGTGTQVNTNTFMTVNLVTAGVVRVGETYPAKVMGFGCSSVSITYTQVSLVSDCVVGVFDNGGTCSSTCGGGRRTRKRAILQDVSGAEYGAQKCPSLTTDEACNTQPCPIDCVMGDWSAWGACSNPCTCDGCPNGVAKRTRSQANAPAFGGSNCGVSVDVKNCNTQPCPIDCVASDWSDFGPCSQTCGGTGTYSRSKTVIKPAQFGGRDCPPDTLRDVAPCNTHPCPIDCKQEDWTPWSPCSRDCGGGTQQRGRKTLVQPNYGGTACGPDLQQQDCNKQDCPVDCQLSEWTAWGPCDQDCDTGSNTRTRTIVKAPTQGGLPCDDLTDQGACNTQACPVDKLATLIKRIRHLELQDRVSSLEEEAIKQAQDSVTKTAFGLASAAATPVSVLSIKETVHTGQQQQEHERHTYSRLLGHLPQHLVQTAHPFSRPALTQLLASEILVDELAKWAAKHDEILDRAKASSSA